MDLERLGLGLLASAWIVAVIALVLAVSNPGGVRGQGATLALLLGVGVLVSLAYAIAGTAAVGILVWAGFVAIVLVLRWRRAPFPGVLASGPAGVGAEASRARRVRIVAFALFGVAVALIWLRFGS